MVYNASAMRHAMTNGQFSSLFFSFFSFNLKWIMKCWKGLVSRVTVTVMSCR